MNPVIKFCAGLFITVTCLLGSFSYLTNLLNAPIVDIRLEGELSSYNYFAILNEVEKSIRNERFFNIDLFELHKNLVNYPQIASLNIRKVWPNTVIVQAVEQTPIARWGEDKFLNNRGQIFNTQQLVKLGLPKLTGDDSMQEKVLKHYQLFNSLLAPLKLNVMELDLKGYDSWYLKVKNQTGNNINLAVGGAQILAKIERFSTWYSRLSQDEVVQLKQVDLRYRSAFAVVWSDR